MLTAAQLAKVFPACRTPEVWAQALTPAMERYEINTNNRIAAFLAQTGYESGQFNRLVENLNYSTAKRLVAVWPKRFPTEQYAQSYVNNPQKLANFVYANRLGNGDAASGDGYRYRGRGLIQLTGRSNYQAAATAMSIDCLNNPDLLLQARYAALSAAHFWFSHGLNAKADDGTPDDDLEDFRDITYVVNGGYTGVNDRLALFNQIEPLLA